MKVYTLLHFQQRPYRKLKATGDDDGGTIIDPVDYGLCGGKTRPISEEQTFTSFHFPGNRCRVGRTEAACINRHEEDFSFCPRLTHSCKRFSRFLLLSGPKD